MKFNPISGHLWTNDGRLLKKLNCPIGATSKDIIHNESAAKCKLCHRSIIDVYHMDDKSVAALFDANPDQCIKLSLDAPNMEIVFDV